MRMCEAEYENNSGPPLTPVAEERKLKTANASTEESESQTVFLPFIWSYSISPWNNKTNEPMKHRVSPGGQRSDSVSTSLAILLLSVVTLAQTA